MIAYLPFVATGAGIAIVVIGAVWVLSARISKLEQKVDDIPAVINGSVLRTIQAHCATERERCHVSPYARTVPMRGGI